MAGVEFFNQRAGTAADGSWCEVTLWLITPVNELTLQSQCVVTVRIKRTSVAAKYHTSGPRAAIVCWFVSMAA